jgi:hypothetical protein
MNSFDKAWDVLKIQDWLADNPRPNRYSTDDPNVPSYPLVPTASPPFKANNHTRQLPQKSPFNNRRGNYAPQQGDAFFPAVPPQQPRDPITEQRNNPMAQVNPNVPKHFQQNNQSPNQPPPPNMDPSWTPEAIARINAQNDEARRALRGGQ